MHKWPSFNQLQNSFTEWLARLGYAAITVAGHRRRIKRFFRYLEAQGITKLEMIDSTVIKGYENYLDHQPIVSATIAGYLVSIKLLNEYLEKYGYGSILQISFKPGIRPEFHKTILTKAEVSSLYQVTDQSVVGYKDRAMLGLYYGCGLRAKEGRLLRLDDIDFKSSLLQVKKSKTYRPRYVPMSSKVQSDLKEWLEYGRPLVMRKTSDYVLLHPRGHHRSSTALNERLKQLVAQAGINKKISLHSLRHSIATHLLESGMKLEQIRQFLGHRSLETTQKYTHLLYI